MGKIIIKVELKINVKAISMTYLSLYNSFLYIILNKFNKKVTF